MSYSPENELKIGAQAMRQARYAEAIPALERFCKESLNRRSKTFFQAQMWLIQAYQKNGQDLHAIALCEQLVKSDIPQVQQWGQKVLSQLLQDPQPRFNPPIGGAASPEATTGYTVTAEGQPSGLEETAPTPPSPSFLKATTLLSPEAASALFATGRKALQKHSYDEAILALEQFIGGTNPTYSNYGWACSSLGKAYRGSDQPEKALLLCQHLQAGDQENLKTWAKDFIKTLDWPQASPPALEEAAPVPSQSPSEAVPLDRTPSRPGATRHLSPSQQRKPQGKDLSPQILSALAHGSISLLASLLIWMLFMDSTVANLLGLLRYTIPLVILLTSHHERVKANAREALNYVITCLLFLVATVVAVFLLVPLAIVLWPFMIPLGLAVGVYSLVLSIWPVIGTILCARDDQRIFRYPNWLILHLL